LLQKNTKKPKEVPKQEEKTEEFQRPISKMKSKPLKSEKDKLVMPAPIEPARKEANAAPIVPAALPNKVSNSRVINSLQIFDAIKSVSPIQKEELNRAQKTPEKVLTPKKENIEITAIKPL
jgi:hypothetical protein